MMMKQRIFLLLTLVMVSGLSAKSQQRSLYSQYMFNDLAVNPAVAGVRNFIPLHFSVRRQWMGIREAPSVQNLSGHGYIGKDFGLGVNFYNQTAGPSRRAGFEFSTAYHIDLTEGGEEARSHCLSFGLAASMFQYVIDKNQLTTDLPDDPAIVGVVNNQVIPEANFGAYYQKGPFYAGFSVFNLLQTKRFLIDNPYNTFQQVRRTYYLTSGYRYKASDGITLDNSVMLQSMESLAKVSFQKGNSAIPFQFDINSRIIYKDLVFFGLSYRFKDAMVGHVGIQRPSFRIAYSYDYSVSSFVDYNSGSHELGLTLFLVPSVGTGTAVVPPKRGEQSPRRTIQFKKN